MEHRLFREMRRYNCCSHRTVHVRVERFVNVISPCLSEQPTVLYIFSSIHAVFHSYILRLRLELDSIHLLQTKNVFCLMWPNVITSAKNVICVILSTFITVSARKYGLVDSHVWYCFLLSCLYFYYLRKRG